MNQCGACGIDLYDYDIVHCMDCGHDVHTDCKKTCVECGHDGCRRCFVSINGEWACGAECVEEAQEARIEEVTTRLEELAKRASITGNVSDLKEYLKARRER